MSRGIWRLAPVCKQALWGGKRLLSDYHQHCPEGTCAESWVLSAHEAGSSLLESGPFAGQDLRTMAAGEGRETLGKKGQQFDRFPVLIKLIDAAAPLSVQVHPDDDFALEHEHEYGKTEMWVILQSDPGAFLYFGVEKDVTPEEVRTRAQDGTLENVLRRVPVHPGDVFFIRAGTIHAIGAGITLCEIQQNSNTTYRLYDYNRRDRQGKLRPLHLEKALCVCDLKKRETAASHLDPQAIPGGMKTRLGQCRYFSVDRYDCETACPIPLTEDSFCSVVVLTGEGTLSVGEERISVQPGDSFYLPAQEGVCRMEGKFSVCAPRLE